MGKIPENYLGPKQRVELFKKEHGSSGSIETDSTLTVVGDSLCVLIKATIKVDGKIVATGHGFTATPEEEKDVEKAETVAVGRALLNAGYPDLLDEYESSDAEEAPKKEKSSAVLGLGKTKPALVKNEEADEETDSEDEDEDDGETEYEAAAPAAEVSKSEPKKVTREELMAKYKLGKKTA